MLCSFSKENCVIISYLSKTFILSQFSSLWFFIAWKICMVAAVFWVLVDWSWLLIAFKIIKTWYENLWLIAFTHNQLSGRKQKEIFPQKNMRENWNAGKANRWRGVKELFTYLKFSKTNIFLAHGVFDFSYFLSRILLSKYWLFDLHLFRFRFQLPDF